MNAIEREFPSYKPLYPSPTSPHASRVTSLLKLERRVFSAWFSWLTCSADAPAEKEMDSLLRQVDEELRSTQEEGPYFLGSDVSIVDIMFAPFLERMAASLPYYKGFESRSTKYPHLLRWYESMDTREAYIGIKSDYYTHCQDLPPQIGKCYFRLPLAARFRDEIGRFVCICEYVIIFNYLFSE
jgi:glutathione S-transferase